ncbi:threonine synthase [Paenibacillus plantarum]|uniref:threonine synthase n=1 Tax=Paenibacillus plantarum TaxID=2654975 RepID=UPI001491C24A|nr:pyridoxal-phosphate dependent enzyme [Paenibacillus plantarum]
MWNICSECGTEQPESYLYACPSCEGILLPQYENGHLSISDSTQKGIWRYHASLPPVPAKSRLYLGEGMTPLIPSVRLGRKLGIGELYFKYEGGNPTGSYKDRIAAMGLSWALGQGRGACIGTSSGNAGAAIAAYAARAGMPYHLFVLENVAEAKLAQSLLYKANVRKIKGFGNDPEIGMRVFDRIFEGAADHGWEVMITAFRYNPYAMEGVKTIAYEIYEELKGMPSHVYSPAGGGGLYCGIWKGFNEIYESVRTAAAPCMVAVQPEGCSNIVRAYQAGSKEPLPGSSTSQISGLQVPNPPDGKLALQIMNRGGGKGIAVSDSLIWETQRLLAVEEGIFCEPAGAASVAGLIRDCEENPGRSLDKVVCVISGNGFKDGKRLSDMTSEIHVPCLDVEHLDI